MPNKRTTASRNYKKTTQTCTFSVHDEFSGNGLIYEQFFSLDIRINKNFTKIESLSRFQLWWRVSQNNTSMTITSMNVCSPSFLCTCEYGRMTWPLLNSSNNWLLEYFCYLFCWWFFGFVWSTKITTNLDNGFRVVQWNITKTA